MSAALSSSDARRGAFAAATCYLAWGLFPLFWKRLSNIDAVELIAHRHLSSLLFVLGVMVLGQTWPDFTKALRSRAALAWHAGSGVLLTLNWLVFIWAVNHGHVLEASLGYFLVPLVNVALGRFVLKEDLRLAQWIAIGCAAIGVALIIVRVGRPPWIAIALAATFGAYGLLRKQSTLGPLVGLGLETLLLSPFALGYVIWRQMEGTGALGHVSASSHVLLLCAGIVTAVPLLLFAYGARRIRFTTLGLLQYIAPTVQFALGVWLYAEEFSPAQASAFLFIWAGLALYTFDNLWNQPAPVTG
ncbi:MAG: EamA family transporter RarD [Opitutus sp.]